MILAEFFGATWWVWTLSGVVPLLIVMVGLFFLLKDDPIQDAEDWFMASMLSTFSVAVGFFLWPAFLGLGALVGAGYGLVAVPVAADKYTRARKSKKRLKLVQQRNEKPDEWRIEHELQVGPHHDCNPKTDCRLALDRW